MIFTLNLRTLSPLRLCGRYSEFRLRLWRAGRFVVKTSTALGGQRKALEEIPHFLIGIDDLG